MRVEIIARQYDYLRNGVSETQVVNLWQNLLSRGTPLFTESGEPLDVIYPGVLNNDYGADFRDVVINSSGGTAKGQIKFHVKSSDWFAHRHNVNTAYQNVILHVVLWNDAPVRNAEGCIPTLSLMRYLDINLLRSLRLGETTDSPVSCRRKSGSTLKEILPIIEAAGEARFQEKAVRFSQELRVGDPGQVLYRGIMGALGYSKNKIQFIELADRVPLKELEAESLSQKDILARLLEAAGDWVMYKVRPVNSPERRITGMSVLISRCSEGGLLKSLVNKVGVIQCEGAETLRDIFVVAGLIGSDRASEIAVNILLPFVYGMEKHKPDNLLAEKAFELFRHYPGAPANAIEKHMANQLGLNCKTVNTALKQQGLLHIYRTMCIQGKCGECQLNTGTQ